MPSAGSFHILNTGNDVAKDVEVGLDLHPGGYIQLIPDFDHAVQCSEKVIATKSCRIKISRLPANHSVHVFIGRGKFGTDQQEGYIDMFEAIGIPTPKIEYALFGDGHMANFRGGLKNQNVILGKVQR